MLTLEAKVPISASISPIKRSRPVGICPRCHAVIRSLEELHKKCARPTGLKGKCPASSGLRWPRTSRWNVPTALQPAARMAAPAADARVKAGFMTSGICAETWKRAATGLDRSRPLLGPQSGAELGQKQARTRTTEPPGALLWSVAFRLSPSMLRQPLAGLPLERVSPRV